MKRMKRGIWILPLVLGVVSCGGNEPQNPDVEGFVLAEFSDLTLSYFPDQGGYFVDDYRGSESSIRLPDKAKDGKSIVGISSNAFFKRDYPKSLWLGENVRTLEPLSFCDSSIEHLYVTESLAHIDNEAFVNSKITFNVSDNLTYLPSVNNPYFYLIGANFDGKGASIWDGYKPITIHPDCVRILDGLFQNYGGVVYGYPKLRYVGEDNFSKAELSIKETVSGQARILRLAELPEKACPLIETDAIFLDESVKEIDLSQYAHTFPSTAFYCAPDAHVTFTDLPLHRMNFFFALGSKGYQYRKGQDTLTSDAPYSINDGYVVSNGEAFFYDRFDEEEVTVPSSITSLGYYLFALHPRISSVKLHDNVTVIGEGCFDYSNISSFSFPSELKEIGTGAFYGCAGLSSATLPQGVTQLGESTFHYCTGLRSLSIPSSVKFIPKTMAFGCSALSNVEIANGPSYIDEFAFTYCSALERITIPASIVRLGSCCFSRTNLHDIDYPGTDADWKNIKKEDFWKSADGNFGEGNDLDITVHCSNGDIPA